MGLLNFGAAKCWPLLPPGARPGPALQHDHKAIHPDNDNSDQHGATNRSHNSVAEVGTSAPAFSPDEVTTQLYRDQITLLLTTAPASMVLNG